MTDPKNTEPGVVVTDADKHAAEAFWMAYGPFAWGTIATLYEAFACHRTAAEAEALAEEVAAEKARHRETLDVLQTAHEMELALIARVQQLKAALKPFADTDLTSEHNGSDFAWDVLRARAALTGQLK